MIDFTMLFPERILYTVCGKLSQVYLLLLSLQGLLLQTHGKILVRSRSTRTLQRISSMENKLHFPYSNFAKPSDASIWKRKENKGTTSEQDFIKEFRTVCCKQKCADRSGRKKICKIPRPCCDECTMTKQACKQYYVKFHFVNLEFEYFRSNFLSAKVISPRTT